MMNWLCLFYSISMKKSHDIIVTSWVLSGDVLKNGIIRYVNATSFVEDALRVFRAAQFAARFDFTIADETKNLMKTIDTRFLSKERVYGELKKTLLLSSKPITIMK